MKLKLHGALFHCGRCRKRYSNPFGHVCVAPIGREGKTRFRPSASAVCPACHQPYGNPFTHTCTVRTGYRGRARRPKQAARKARPEHPRPSACRDGDCKRAACVAYREALEAGYEDGYDIGFAEGTAACPREHK